MSNPKLSNQRRAGQSKRRGDHRWLVSVFLGRDPDTGEADLSSKDDPRHEAGCRALGREVADEAP